MAAGIRAVGDDSLSVMQAHQYVRPDADVAVFYGLAGRLQQVFSEYSADPARRAVYVDLGYFGRKDGGLLRGYHKISVDARHPTAYFRRTEHSSHRIRHLGVRVRPWRAASSDAPIIVAGMGPKGAMAEGYSPGQWETQAVALMRRHTKRPIIYRPKPNWPEAAPIPGAMFSKPGAVALSDQIRGAHAVVSHHSNANVEALVEGVPSFSVAGVATTMGLTDLAMIETPLMPETRPQWLADLAWCQWNVEEMANGSPWRHMKKEGLIP